jgi:DNA-binding transcriptional ArsR family regulator
MTALYESRERANEAAEKLKIYAQPQRLMILSRLLEGEHTVGEIFAATGVGQPALSQQLAGLRRAELVATRRVAKQVYYRLADERAAVCVRSVEAIFGNGRDVAAALAAALPGVATASAKPAPKEPRRAGAAAFAKIV